MAKRSSRARCVRCGEVQSKHPLPDGTCLHWVARAPAWLRAANRAPMPKGKDQ